MLPQHLTDLSEALIKSNKKLTLEIIISCIPVHLCAVTLILGNVRLHCRHRSAALLRDTVDCFQHLVALVQHVSECFQAEHILSD